ncbi:MAG TPA: phosphodiester glycosidase family protein, partial [Hymenobacter sp.]
MNHNRFLLLIFLVLLIGTIVFLTDGVRTGDKQAEQDENLLVTYVVDPSKTDVSFFWKNDNQPFKSIENLRLWLEQKNQRLVFAMNAGMYQSDNSPKGLYIEKGVIKVPLDTASGEDNFYLKPNGVFYIGTDKAPAICTTSEFSPNGSNAYYATQSGPMLVVDGKINPAFKPASTNLNIRNGVGIL